MGVIRLGIDPPSLLFQQLAAHGYCLLDNTTSNVLLDSMELLSGWFQRAQHEKQAAAGAATPADAADADAARGFFTLPDKEVLEVKNGWKSDGLQADARLAVNAVRMPQSGLEENISNG
jgi:hypothetical protein